MGRNDDSVVQRVMDMVHKEAIEAVKAGEGIRKEPAEYIRAMRAELGRKQSARALRDGIMAMTSHQGETAGSSTTSRVTDVSITIWRVITLTS